MKKTPMIDNPVRLVRELKGAPLSILFALGLAGGRVTASWLERATGYTDKPVAQGLAYLQEIGLVDHNSAGWLLTGQARQLPLGFGGELEETTEAPEDISDTDDPDRNISDITTTTLNNNNLNYKGSSSNTARGRNFSENCQVLGDLGIQEPKRSELARLEWVTPAAIRAHQQDLKQRKRGRYSLGLLIHVLESGEPAPGELLQDDRDKFVSGEFAEFIEH